jgi:hypothetical protein
MYNMPDILHINAKSSFIASQALVQDGILHNAPQQPSKNIAAGDDPPGFVPEQDDVMIHHIVLKDPFVFRLLIKSCRRRPNPDRS